MVVECKKCQKIYDDARNWTICPHRRLEDNPLETNAQQEPILTLRTATIQATASNGKAGEADLIDLGARDFRAIVVAPWGSNRCRETPGYR